MWVVTGSETYRLNALKVIRNYYSITKVAPHWDSQIRWSIAAYKMGFAAEVLRASDPNSPASRWTDDDTTRFSRLLKMGEPLMTGTGYWMNQHGFSTMGLMATAIFLDDRARYEECVERTTVNARGEQGGRNGSVKWQMRLVTENPVTNEKVDPPQVQVAEMARDQGHAWINPIVLSTLAQTLWNQGTRVDPVSGKASAAADAVDVFSFLNDRLLAGTDFLARYSLGEPVTWVPLAPGSQIQALREREWWAFFTTTTRRHTVFLTSPGRSASPAAPQKEGFNPSLSLFHSAPFRPGSLRKSGHFLFPSPALGTIYAV